MLKLKNGGFISTTNGRGFQLRFPNGVVMSTQFGAGSYCANRDSRDWKPDTLQSGNAEVAFFMDGCKREWRTREIALAAGFKVPEDDVIGWVSFADWLKLLDAAREFK